MDKRVIFPTNDNGKRDSFFVCEDKRYLEKRASNYHPLVQAYIDKAKPIDNLVQVLLTALGAFETWNLNSNGDAFRAAPLAHEGDDYGYKTFLTNANYFTHHVNKDPLLAKGKVLHAVWNEKMKRVELVVGIDVNKDPEAISEMDNGNSLCFSMGCKTPYDVCLICSNKAKTRAEYCDHAKYMLNQIDPVSGLLVGVDNPFPKFFDISRVLIPADKTAYMWTKVASAANNPFKGVPSAFIAEATSGSGDLMKKIAEYRDQHGLDEKKASVKKDATIIKRIPVKSDPVLDNIGERAALVNTISEKLAPPLPKEALDHVALSIPLPQILTTLATLGIAPTQDEFNRLAFREFVKEKDFLTDGEKVRCFMERMFDPESFNPSLAEIFMPLVPYRSFFRPHLLRRLIIIAKKEPQVKMAEEIKTLLNPRVGYPEEMGGKTTATVAGLMAAAYLVLRKIFPQQTANLTRVISENPYLAMAVGAGAIGVLKGAQSATGITATGMYDVDDPNREFYNRNWQSRFARLQARPVAVIKTAYGKKVDTALAKKIFLGVPAIFAGSTLMKAHQQEYPEKSGPVARFAADNPELMSAGLLLEHHAGKPVSKYLEPVSKHLGQALQSAKRIIKKASIDDEEFLSMLPDGDYETFTDLAILTNAVRITDKLLGGK